MYITQKAGDVRFEWDPRKNVLNIRKHNLSFETAKFVFQDPQIHSELDRILDGEERWQSIGYVDDILIVLVAHTTRDEDGEEVIHILSARKATKRERNRYEEEQR